MAEQQWRFGCKLRNVKLGVVAVLFILCLFVFYKWNVEEERFSNGYSERMSKLKRNDQSYTFNEMAFTSYENYEIRSYGKPFDIKLQKYLQQFGLMESQPVTKEIEAFNPTDIILVTYASSDHFHESKAGLRNWRNLTNYKIVYYDLGLTVDQADQVKNLCNVDYVKFNFNLYPPHVRTLTTYAFKPILIADMYLKYKTFWILDSSVRFLDAQKLAEFHDAVNNKKFEPYTINYKVGHSIYAATQAGTFTYLPLPPNLAKLEMHAATIQFVHASSFSREVVKWNFLCALTKECIAPQGHYIFCKFTKDRFNDFAHCHRYDQSTVNIVHLATLQKYGYETLNNRTSFRTFIDIRRGENYIKKLYFDCK